MPRSIRIEYPGAYYHIMARGNRREAIFHDEKKEKKEKAKKGSGSKGVLPKSEC